MTVHLRTSLSPETAPLATLVQSTLFDYMYTGTPGAATIAYQSTGGIFEGVFFDPCIQVTWTGGTPSPVKAYVGKYLNFSPSYNDGSWRSRRPAHYRFRWSVSTNWVGFANGNRVELLRLFHNSGVTGQTFAGVWLQRSTIGWRVRLDEFVTGNNGIATPTWEFYSQTLATFTPYFDMTCDIVTTPGAAVITVGAPQASTRIATLAPGFGFTGITNQGHTSLSLAGATLPRLAGFEFGAVTMSIGTLATACVFKFDDIKAEDDFDYNWSPDEDKSINGTSFNPAREGWSGEADYASCLVFPNQTVVFGGPLSNLYSAGFGFNDSSPGSVLPSCNIAVEPNGQYMLSAIAASGFTALGNTQVCALEFATDMAYPTTNDIIDFSLPDNNRYVLRTGPHQNVIVVTNKQPNVYNYTLRRLR